MESILPSDIISTLPDDILGHILSFFPTKEAVWTSILSNRWRYMWAFASKIIISDGSSHKILPKFTVFTYKVLRDNRVCCLEEIELKFTFNYNSRDLRKWMYYTSLHKTLSLDLEFPFKKHVKLPTSFFSSDKLVSTTLSGGIILKAPKLVHFPSLKSLDMYDIQFSADDSMKNILAGKPVLEVLSITRNRRDTINTLHIESNSLTFLLLDVCEEISFEGSELVVVIEAPNLLAFHIYDCSIDEYKVGHIPSLLYGNISVREGLLCNDSTLVELLRKMSSVEYLHLAKYTFEYLRPAHLDNLPIFVNLTKLHVEFNQSSGKVWSSILASAPNLKILEFEKRYKHHDNCQWHPPCYVSYSLSSSLENIEFSGFGASAAEVEMVAYLLKKARVLKKMMITLHELLEERPMLYEQLVMLPKVSVACQIELC